MKSLRRQDMRAESELGKFMDEAFYSKLHDNQGNPVKFIRYEELDKQKQGIDVCLEVRGKSYLIDEKASLYYSNAMIPTFAFEVEFIQPRYGKHVIGWLLNEQLKTEYYMLIWPNVKCDGENEWKRISINELKKNDFTIVEAMLIRKQDILTYLKNNFWDKKRIISLAEKLRDAKNTDGLLPNKKDDFYFTYTKGLAEKPINIVIRKKVLRKLALADWFISRENYAKIEGEKKDAGRGQTEI